MRHAIKYALVVALSTMPFSPSALAQLPVPSRSHTQGFNVGIHANGSAHKMDGSDVTESGGGLGLRLGWGITNNVMLYAQADAAAMESEDGSGEYSLAHVDLGARFSFSGPSSAWRPYVDIAVNGRGAAQTFDGSDVTITGSGFTGGVGLQYFMTRRLGLDIGLKYTAGKYTEFTVDGESFEVDPESTMSTRVNFGFSWFPGG